jgi:phage FluMu gp28-like protein
MGASQNIYFGKDFAWLKYFTCLSVSVQAPNYNQHILSPAEVRKVCYSLAELYVIFVYLNLFGCRGHEVHETLERGAQGIKVWEPLP